MPESKVSVIRSRWAVEVEGHPATISRLENFLKETLFKRSDSFISRLRDVAALRSQLWDKIDDAQLVGQFAQTELAFLQGLTRLAGGASPLSVGTVFELSPDDSIVNQTRHSINDIYVLSCDLDSPALFRQRMDIVRQHDALRGAVIELSGSADWIKIYKAVEYLEECFGGERELNEAHPSKKAALKRIKRTAQAVRHRARNFENVAVPFKLEDADKFLQTLLKDIVASIAPSSASQAKTTYIIPKRDYPPEQVIGLKPLILVNGEESEVGFVGDTLSVA